VHVPGLRKWCFPLFENKTPPGYTPRHTFKPRHPSGHLHASASPTRSTHSDIGRSAPPTTQRSKN
jgi:hypothetical protein